MGNGESRLAASQFSVGDRVIITLENDVVTDLLKSYQQDWKKGYLIGKVGTVQSIDPVTGNVCVKYPNDEICVNPIILVKQSQASTIGHSNSQGVSSGQLVRLNSNLNDVKELQAGHGEWLTAMEICLGRVGYVKRVFTSGDCRVYFGYSSWTINPKALKVIPAAEVQALIAREKDKDPSIGDLIKVSNDLSQVKREQKGHGEWDDAMECTIGQFGFVKHIYADKDLRIKILDRVWTLNPKSISIVVSVANSPVGSSNTLMGKTVKIISDESKVRVLQNGHGGWASEMKVALGATGTVTAVQSSGDLRVKIGHRTWTLNPKCVTTGQEQSDVNLSVGTKVRVSSSQNDVKRLQDGHGQWTDAMKNILGKEGKILKIFPSGDIRVEISGSSWTLNPACVTTLSEDFLTSTTSTSTSTSNCSTPASYSVGDCVKVMSDENTVKRLQNGGPGWVDSMRSCLGKVGRITAVFPSGNVKVKINNEQWTFKKDALTKVSPQEEVDTTIRRGDSVRIISDEERLKSLQDGHGEWIDLMKIILGRKGQVESILPSGDLRVKVMGTSWTINPAGVTKLERSSSSGEEDAEEALEALMQLAQRLGVDDDDDDEEEPSGLETLLGLKDSIFDAARAGDVTKIKTYIDRGDDINRSFGTHTALHVAANQGHVDAVKLLLERGADHSLKDKDGDTPLHDAIAGGQPKAALEIIKFRGVDLNARNNKQMTPLHMAARRDDMNVIKQLLECGANIDVQDEDGDTPLHDAIMKENGRVIDFLIEKGAQLSIANLRGFTPLHLAAKQNNISATRSILNKQPGLVNEKKEDGYTALQLTATNNHKELSTMLIERYNADMDVPNNKCQTALHLAAVRGHLDIVKLLVRNGAYVNCCDEDGDTPLHETLRKYSMGALSQFGFSGLMAALMSEGEGDPEVQKEIALFLTTNGADTAARNKKNQLPVDLCRNDEMKRQIINESSKATVMKKPAGPRQGYSRVQGAGAAAGPSANRSNSTVQPNIASNSNNENANQGDINTKDSETKKEDVDEYDNQLCPICFDNKKNLAFGCGHVVCRDCSYMLTKCPFCNVDITLKIPLYLN